MSWTKEELKDQLQQLGFKVEKNRVYRGNHDVKADDAQKRVYYKADWFHDLDAKKPDIKQKTASKKPEGWFETEEEAKSHFLGLQKTAKERAVEIQKELDALKKRLGFEIGYTMEGDTHGIYRDYLYLNIKVDDYTFNLKIESD